MDNVDLYLFGRQFKKRIGKGFHRTIHVTFYDDVKLLEVTDRQTTADLIQGNVFLRTQALFPLQLLAFVRYFPGFLLTRGYQYPVARLGGACETQQGYRGGRTCFVDLFVPFVEHGFHPSGMNTRNDRISNAECTALNHHRGNNTPSFVQLRFHNRTGSTFIGVCPQVKHFGFKQHLFQQLIDVQSFFG